MATTVSRIDAWRAARSEHQNLEFKEAKAQFDNRKLYSLRDRFKLPEDKAASVSQIIAATMEAGKIKLADPTQTSTRYRSYVPFWA